MTEIRFTVDDETVLAVLDGHCHASGEDRASLVRRLLCDWAGDALHRSIVICRTARVNPAAMEERRRSTDAVRAKTEGKRR